MGVLANVVADGHGRGVFTLEVSKPAAERLRSFGSQTDDSCGSSASTLWTQSRSPVR